MTLILAARIVWLSWRQALDAVIHSELRSVLEVSVRRLVLLAIATAVFGCSNPPKMAEQAPLPAPTPPSMQAPICARPAERAAINVSALVSELQVITLICRTDDKYNTQIRRLRPALATKEKDLRAYFSRAYGKRAQAEHDRYITELANLQSQLASKSGGRFCSVKSNIFDEVMPLSSVQDLATYTEIKPIQQAFAVDECSTTPAGQGSRKASR